MSAIERGYEQPMKLRQELEVDEDMEVDIRKSRCAECKVKQGRRWREEFANVEDTEQHSLFTSDLTKDTWARFRDE